MPKLRIGKPQLFAGLLLLLFFCEGWWMIENKPVDTHDYATLHCGRVLWGIAAGACELPESALAARAAAAPLLVVRSFDGQPTRRFSEWDLFRFAPWTLTMARLPFLLFGLWLGGGLWWVARRLFGNAGGYTALALYCTSPLLIGAASSLAPDIIAAWGFFGAIYTAIGIGHTILAPVREWKFRVLLLGIALGATFAAVPAAGVVALALAIFFLLYLAPERRRQALAALGAACAIGGFAALLCADFHVELLGGAWPGFSWRWILRFFSELANIPLYALAAIALAVFLGWRRTRYFGNWSALLIALLAPWFVASSFLASSLIAPGMARHAEPLAWTLPFLFVFIGGVFADLYETRQARLFKTVAVLLIAAHAGWGWQLLRHAAERLRLLGFR